MNESTLWKTVLGEIELMVSKASFVTWFKNTHLIENSDGKLTVGVPNVFTKKQMEDRYHEQIKSVLVKHGVKVESIDYKIKTVSKPKIDEEINLAPAVDSMSSRVKSAPVGTTALNPKYVFDSFIVGSSNDLAYAASQAIAKDPGNKYNPLFVYGGAGLGKTHLIQAIGNSVIKENPDAKVIYVPCEQFVKEFLHSIRYKKRFGDRYRSADVLIVDDIQFIAGKERTEEEFFHTFNSLHQANKQIILSSDQPPKTIPVLENRLRSRFEWGMTADIQAPDFEMRCAILQAKANQQGMNLKQDCIEYLATHIQNNIRELEGVLNQLVALCELKGTTPSVEMAVSLLGSTRPQPKRLTAKQIIERTARHFQIELEEMLGPKRDKDIVVPRQVAMYLLRNELNLSFPKVAKELGRKDHTTAIHSVEKIEKSINADHLMRGHVNDIKERLYA